MSPDPFVSVVMPVRNAMPYLHAAIRSILEQTHRELELVIRDDASTDGSTEALREWARRDRRIRLFEGEASLGPAEASDWVVRQASAPIVARMDADDLSHPDRLRRQLAVLANEPEVVLVGSLWEGIDPRGRRIRGRDRSRLARPSFIPPFPHGSIVFRREAFERVGGYRAECVFWEDLDLCLRLATLGRIVVLPDLLYSYRFSPSSTRLTSGEERVERAVELMVRCVEAHRQGESYEGLIDAACPPAPNGRRDPRAIQAIGSGRLWSGQAPGVFLRLLRRAALRWDGTSLRALAWVLLATPNPRLFRLCAGAAAWLRDRSVRRRFADGTLCEWRFQTNGGAR